MTPLFTNQQEVPGRGLAPEEAPYRVRGVHRGLFVLGILLVIVLLAPVWHLRKKASFDPGHFLEEWIKA